MAPSLEENGTWPHVEGKGLLCLKSTLRGHNAGERAIRHVGWAIDLLNFDFDTRCREFRREFISYWGRSCDTKHTRTLYSLVTPDGQPREICYFIDSRTNELIFADGRPKLTTWLQNSSRNPRDRDIKRTWFAWLDEPWTPQMFPKTGCDILPLVPPDFLKEVARAGNKLPILIGIMTESGPVLGCVMLETARKNDLMRGFRPSKLPVRRVIDSMGHRPVKRLAVSRVDGAYVHGRDRDTGYVELALKTVAVVGCGALGGFVTRLLTQAGVGKFVLVDPDTLETQNTARHVLGHRFVGKSKSSALASALGEDFPHIQGFETYQCRVEQLLSQQPDKLASCDLIISSGIELVGDAALNRWRLALDSPPAHICTWVEAYALAGHAIALLGKGDLMQALDSNDNPIHELTRWDNAQILIQEAGCGNVFQPHGSIDLQRTVVLAARLALDVLTHRGVSSAWRTWQGDRNEVRRLGGTPSAGFDASNVEQHRPWKVLPAKSE